MLPTLLILIPLRPENEAAIAAQFNIITAVDQPSLDEAISKSAKEIKAVLTNGTIGIRSETIHQLPALELIAALGAGYENIDLPAAKARNITVANGAATNDDCVADHAFALLISIVRQIPALDRACRNGIWRDDLPFQPNFSGKKLGVIGLGAIGRKIACRAEGFDTQIGYHNRQPAQNAPASYQYFDTPTNLAEWADYLVIATPGGASTRHLVNAAVLKALGPQGYLVNVARGSVVDSPALADALTTKSIAGAGLDVYEGEPTPPVSLIGLENIILTPHVAGRSPEAVAASIQKFIDNATRHFAGHPVLTAI